MRAQRALRPYLPPMRSTVRIVQSLWRRLAPLPGGTRLFSRILGWLIPYSGSVRPHVLRLEPGHARVELRERRRLRNHLRSVHALALANLGELASGLAMAMALPDDTRGIPIRIEIDYLKKARGRIVAEGHAAPPPAIPDEQDATATADLTDETGTLVARMTVTWRLSPPATEASDHASP
jgi:acyl-coenzyme A thioesterase PaaI-like protein